MADTTVQIKSSSGWKFKVALGAIGLIVITILAFLFQIQFGIVILACGLAGSVRIVFWAIHQNKLSQYEMRRLEAEVLTLEYAADKARIERHFLETKSGVFHLAHGNEMVSVKQFYPAVNASRDLIETPLLLPAPVEPVDLLSAFTQPQQCYAIIGGQQTGKTFQARHIAAYWLGKGIQPWVVAPKWDKGEWNGCKMFGGLSDFEAVRVGIGAVRSEANKRHADKDLGHREHALLPIFFDDWTVLVEPIEEASSLILEATTLYASVNIILYFIIHSDTTDAWGVKTKGAALKNNFCKLFIEPDYNSSGQMVRQNLKGWILFPGETEKRPARLFSGLPIMPAKVEPDEHVEKFSESSNSFTSEKFSEGDNPLWDLPALMPTPTESRVCELKKQGASLSKIALDIYGSKGGWQVEEVKKILSKFGMLE